MSAFLLNESVYMPLQHFILPAELFGNLMFSEMWVDPDSGNEQENGRDGEKSRKMLIKFDIKDVGYFDMIIINSCITRKNSRTWKKISAKGLPSWWRKTAWSARSFIW